MTRTIDETTARTLVTEALTATGQTHLIARALDVLPTGERINIGSGKYVERVSDTDYETN